LHELPKKSPLRRLELIEVHQPDARSGKLFAELARKRGVPANRQVVSPSIHAPAQIQKLFLTPADAELPDDVKDPDFTVVGTLGGRRRADIYTFIGRMNFHQVTLNISRIARLHRLIDCAQTRRPDLKWRMRFRPRGECQDSAKRHQLCRHFQTRSSQPH
jgi:hypothetical protein